MRLLRNARAAMHEELRPLLLQQAHVEEDNKETGPVRHGLICLGRRVTCSNDRCFGKVGSPRLTQGAWTVKITQAVIAYEQNKTFAMYVILVQRLDPDNESGWIVTRRYASQQNSLPLHACKAHKLRHAWVGIDGQVSRVLRVAPKA